MKNRRVAITGMAINTPLGDTLETFLEGLLAGRSAVTAWKTYETQQIYSKVGADLGGYDIQGKVRTLTKVLPAEMVRRMVNLVNRASWSVKLSLLLTADAWIDAALGEGGYAAERTAVLVAGHNINQNYIYRNQLKFSEDPEYIEGLFALHGLDTDHAGSISELLQSFGPIYTMGAACASGNVALRNALNEIRYHGNDVALVVGAVLEFSPVDLQGMALMGAIAHQKFNDQPARASRPFDKAREGFVPAHGGAVLVLEDFDRARARGARIYAEVLGVAAASDGSHLPQPSKRGQVAAMRRALEESGIAPERVDFVSAHATSTPMGDLAEVNSIKEVFGQGAYRLKINAPKSILGHTCWAAPTVETVAAVLQMRAGRLHASINIDSMDEAVDLDVCANRGADLDPEICMKNSFGFGGINCVSVLRNVPRSGGGAGR